MPNTPSEEQEHNPAMLSASNIKPRRPLSEDLLDEGSLSLVRKAYIGDDNSTYTKSTASVTLGVSESWNNSSCFSMNSSDVMMAPLNDLGGGSSHSLRESNLNSLRGSSNHTKGSIDPNSLEGDSQHTQGSKGESSLSSFLSVLLEQEATRPSNISIVSDNPRPKQRSIEDIRRSFIRLAYKNDKPKCRWDYLTRDNNDRDQMSRSRRRSKLEVRSLSFSGPISQELETLNIPKRVNSNGSLESSGHKRAGKKNIDGMFLRMPQRKDSPMTEAVKKKSLMSRCVNMSDTDLIILPMQPGLSPKKRRSKLQHPTHYAGNQISGPYQQPPPRLSRSGDHKANIGNAKWSKTDMQRRRRNSNEFLDFLLEPESDGRSCWPSPLPSPSPNIMRSAFQVSHRQLADLSTSFISLEDYSSGSDEDSDDDDSYYEDVKDETKTAAPPRPPPPPKMDSPPIKPASCSFLPSKTKKKTKVPAKPSSCSKLPSRHRQQKQASSRLPPQIPIRNMSPNSPKKKVSRHLTTRRKKFIPTSRSHFPPMSPKSAGQRNKLATKSLGHRNKPKLKSPPPPSGRKTPKSNSPRDAWTE